MAEARVLIIENKRRAASRPLTVLKHQPLGVDTAVEL